jgi:hypothetical protein
MTDNRNPTRDEVERLRRVADQLCTAHAALRDRFSLLHLLMDVTILLFSAWLTAIAFLDPRFYTWLVPFGLDPQFWIGLFGTLTFFMTLIQFKTDWRGRSEAHHRSFSMYAEVKREAGYILATSERIPDREFQRLAARYDMASDVGTAVPERNFLELKRRHKLKVTLSKLLDDKPSISIWLTKFKLFVRDNWT